MANKKIKIFVKNIEPIYNKFVNLSNSAGKDEIVKSTEIQKMYDKARSGWSKTKEEQKIVNHINVIRNKIVQTIYALGEIDKSIDVSAYQANGDKKDLKSNAYKEAYQYYKNGKFKIRKMTLEDCKRLYPDNCFQKNGKWYLQLNNYTYNITNGALTYTNKAGKKVSVNVDYYIPELNDLSSLNTITLISSKDYSGYSGSIVAIPKVSGVDNSKAAAVVASTDFLKNLAKTKSGCRNYVGGGSKYGQLSLFAASIGVAGNKSLYDGVISVNYGLLVSNVDNKDGNAFQKSQFKKMEDVEKMNGKVDFYFVEADGDPNIYTYFDGNNSYAKDEKLNNSYALSGAKIAAKYCQKSEVYFITNSETTSPFKKADKQYENFHYNGIDDWNKLTNSKNYVGHSYENILLDIAHNGMFDTNEYSH